MIQLHRYASQNDFHVPCLSLFCLCYFLQAHCPLELVWNFTPALWCYLLSSHLLRYHPVFASTTIYIGHLFNLSPTNILIEGLVLMLPLLHLPTSLSLLAWMMILLHHHVISYADVSCSRLSALSF